ncbi:alpha/beta hydrolase [Chlamydia sp. 17-3921]|uniref:alpha/beta hydrolase n=1 Tax=Chlamydia sp. 17-3921 TaxID=2675798 RepID=UPI001F44744C|nr:alpha/beta hydrolase [Chlamydia sp. 17-3921]
MASSHEHRSMLSMTLLNDVTTFGVLHTPKYSKAPHPLVIILHGLASDKTGTNRSHVHLAEILSKSGIASLRIDLPGHGDSDRHLQDFSLEDYKASVREIINYALEQPYVDNKNIAIFGSSLGGTLALLNIAAMPQIKSLALWAPTILGSLWLQETLNQLQPIISSTNEEILYAGFPINKAFCSQFLDLNILEEINLFSSTLSILYMQGLQDTLVSPQHQKLFVEAFANKNNPLELKTYPSIDHSFVSTNSSIFSDLIQWLKRELISQG